MSHLSVLYQESLDALTISEEGYYIDCTFGRGGHSRGILKQLGEKGRLLAFDRDLTAINSDVANELREDSRFHLHHGCFSELEAVVNQLGWQGNIAGIFMDLGVSSPQLDEAQRGFSFLREGPLDMRMDSSQGLSAAEWLQQVEEKQLVNVLFEYGEERFSRRIAKAIIERRETAPLTTTLELAKLIENTIPKKDKFKHPATRSFQAIRIEINDELGEIKQVLQQAMMLLKPQGRLVVIAFHSLEDRIVKRFMRDESGRKFNPGRLPIKEADIEQGILKRIGKVVKASSQEIKENPRSRSAVMRIAERI